MAHNVRKTLLTLVITGLIIISVTYGTYAFFQSQATNNKVVGGASESVSYDVSANVVYKATSLIPVRDNIVDLAVNKTTNKCRDDSNRDICSLYEVTVTNRGTALNLSGFVRTSTSTYTTSNLKYKVYTKNGTTYTAVSDVMTLSHNSGDSVYFKKNNANYPISLSTSASKTYYISFWIDEIEGIQNEDQAKDYSCKFGFEGMNGSKLTSSFNV